MFHSFRVDVATIYGIEEAVFLQNIYFWTQKNKANNKHFYDGYYWTYNTQKAFTRLFPYMSQSKLSRMGNKLEEKGLIKTGNYNKIGYDRTKWYTLTEKAELMLNGCNTAIVQNEYSNMQNDLTIPYTNTDTNKNIKNSALDNAQLTTIEKPAATESQDIEAMFNEMWELYPLKRGKTGISITKKKEIFNVGADEFKRCIDRYKKEVEKDRKDFKELRYVNGSTFFNSRYKDYLDKNYAEKEVKPFKLTYKYSDI